MKQIIHRKSNCWCHSYGWSLWTFIAITRFTLFTIGMISRPNRPWWTNLKLRPFPNVSFLLQSILRVTYSKLSLQVDFSTKKNDNFKCRNTAPGNYEANNSDDHDDEKNISNNGSIITGRRITFWPRRLWLLFSVVWWSCYCCCSRTDRCALWLCGEGWGAPGEAPRSRSILKSKSHCERGQMEGTWLCNRFHYNLLFQCSSNCCYLVPTSKATHVTFQPCVFVLRSSALFSASTVDLWLFRFLHNGWRLRSILTESMERVKSISPIYEKPS